jgi:hypothetical protein
MISDEKDKWYENPDIYHSFSLSQDPENLCFELGLKHCKEITHSKSSFLNPIDVGSGTGKLAWYLRENFEFNGKIHCIDRSPAMCDFLKKRIKRENVPEKMISVQQNEIHKIDSIVGKGNSNLVVANFAFPSRVSDRENSILELQAVFSALRQDGLFITFGWDELYNDELNEMWYKYVPDDISARSFDEWRKLKAERTSTARNCGLRWYKRGLKVPVEFMSLETAVKVMGYLFGKSAADEVLRTEKTSWAMSMGITIDTKESLQNTLKELKNIQ